MGGEGLPSKDKQWSIEVYGYLLSAVLIFIY